MHHRLCEIVLFSWYLFICFMRQTSVYCMLWLVFLAFSVSFDIPSTEQWSSQAAGISATWTAGGSSDEGDCYRQWDDSAAINAETSGAGFWGKIKGCTCSRKICVFCICSFMPYIDGFDHCQEYIDLCYQLRSSIHPLFVYLLYDLQLRSASWHFLVFVFHQWSKVGTGEWEPKSNVYYDHQNVVVLTLC